MKRYKQTAIWLFSSSIPLTRIQLWQIPGAASTIRQEWVGVMINCEGHILSMATPASQQASSDRGRYVAQWAPGLHSQNRQLESPTQQNTTKNTAQSSDTAFRLCCNTYNLIHWMACFYRAPHRVWYNTQLTLEIPWTMLIALMCWGNTPVPQNKQTLTVGKSSSPVEGQNVATASHKLTIRILQKALIFLDSILFDQLVVSTWTPYLGTQKLK